MDRQDKQGQLASRNLQIGLRLFGFRRNQQSHRDHRGLVKAVTAEKFLCHIFRAIGQQSDAEKIFLSGEINGVLQQFCAVAVALEFFVNHQIFEEDNEPALGGADGEKQVDHANDGAVASKHKNAAAARLLEN